MKNRDYKVFAANNYYHVYNRGVGKQDIFLDNEDYKFFLSRIKENLFPEQNKTQEGHPLGKWQYVRKQLPSGSFSMVCYCLMPNHFHFLVKQNTDLPVSKLISKICTGYSMYFNKKYSRVGGLFQDQYKAVTVDSDAYVLWLSAYIHQNPTVADLVKKPEDYPWSSYIDYIGIHKDRLGQDNIILDQFQNIKEYREFVEGSLERIKEKKSLEHLFLDSQ